VSFKGVSLVKTVLLSNGLSFASNSTKWGWRR